VLAEAFAQDTSVGLHAVNLENGLGEIQSDRGDLHGGWSLMKGCFNNGHCMALKCRTQGPSTPSV
jgi:hypothetical protein